MRKSKEFNITTILGKGSVCNGEFACEGSLRVDGTINGNITTKENLIIGSTGVVHGDITAKSVIIGGEVVGNVLAPERAEITATAKVLGDLNTTVIVIDEKAVFQGKVNMNQQVPEKKARVFGKTTARKSVKAALAEALKEVEEANKRETGNTQTAGNKTEEKAEKTETPKRRASKAAGTKKSMKEVLQSAREEIAVKEAGEAQKQERDHLDVQKEGSENSNQETGANSSAE